MKLISGSGSVGVSRSAECSAVFVVTPVIARPKGTAFRSGPVEIDPDREVLGAHHADEEVVARAL
jgi:hypothetical protein